MRFHNSTLIILHFTLTVRSLLGYIVRGNKIKCNRETRRFSLKFSSFICSGLIQFWHPCQIELPDPFTTDCSVQPNFDFTDVTFIYRVSSFQIEFTDPFTALCNQTLWLNLDGAFYDQGACFHKMHLYLCWYLNITCRKCSPKKWCDVFWECL